MRRPSWTWDGLKPIIGLTFFLLATSAFLMTAFTSVLISKQNAEIVTITIRGQKEEAMNLPRRIESEGVDTDLNGPISSVVVDDRQNSINPSHILWQNWKTNTKLPTTLERYWNETMKENPTYERRLVDDAEASEFMKRHFSGPTADAYESVNPAIGAMKSDMWRYSVLYKYGGVYTDLDSTLPTKLHEWVDQRGILSCEEQSSYEQICINRFRCPDIWDTMNMTFPKNNTFDCSVAQYTLVFPKPRNPILWETIQLFTSLISTWNDTKQSSQQWPMFNKVLCLTGPCMFSVAVQNAYDGANGDCDKLDANFMGPKFEGKAEHQPKSKNKFKKVMNRASKSYRTLDGTFPVKQES